MNELKRCFAALGFDSVPESPMAVIERAAELMEQRRGGTESDKLARRVIRENRDMCLAELRRQT